MGGEDAEDHGEGVDSGVGDGRGFGSGEGVGECEGGGIGHAAGEQAAEGEVIEVPGLAGDDADDEQGKGGDEDGDAEPGEAGSGEDGAQEVFAGFESDAGEEEGDTEFAEGEVGIGGHVEHEGAEVSEAAEEDGGQEGATGEAESDRLWESGEEEGNDTDEDADGDAGEDGEELGFVQGAGGVAEFLFGLIDVLGSADEVENIAELNAEAGECRHFDVGPHHAGDGDIKALEEGHFSECPAEGLVSGDPDAAVGGVAGCGHEVGIGLGAEDALELVEGFEGTDGEDEVVEVDGGGGGEWVDGVGGRGLDAGQGDAGFLEAGDGWEGEAVEVGVFDLERAAFERVMVLGSCGLEGGGFLGWVDVEDGFQEDEGADDPGDSGGVSDGVGECGQGGAVGCEAGEGFQDLLGCAEGGGVGGGT